MRARGHEGICVVDGCERPWRKRYWCRLHWERWRKFGDPLGFGRVAPIEVRFWRKVCQTDDCWLWVAALTSDGYGSFGGVDGESKIAHKWLWEYLYGLVPDGHELDHLCRNRPCVRPDHLQPVTHLENMRRGIKTVCKRGHGIGGENLYTHGKKRPRRRCRACMLEAQRQYRMKKEG